MSPVAVPDGVELVHEDDGRVTARHVATNVASFGETEAEALRALADARETYRGEAEPIDDPNTVLNARGIDAETDKAGETPGTGDEPG